MLIVPTEKRFDWAHAPIVLFVIVVLNVLMFFGYQALDEYKFEEASRAYYEQDYIDIEWPLYQKYLSEQNLESQQVSTLQLDDADTLYEEGDYATLSFNLLRDDAFHEYLQEHYQSSDIVQQLREQNYRLDDNFQNDSSEVYSTRQTELWLSARQTARQALHSTSAIRHGLTPDSFSFSALISHQFLHGGVMHLMGNLFFLIICGFAVEAAIGHLRFLGFYLLSGVGGGLLHTLFNLDSNIPLVGASGAISGVMAMYLAVFKLRKIEFFYWFFIFVGYFRAPALFILPFYIGSEIFSYVQEPESGTAFMAHVGGFIVGAIALSVSQLIFPKTLNEEYIEEDQSISSQQLSLADIYRAIEKYQFSFANTLLEKHIELYGASLELELIRFNLCINNRKSAAKIALRILKTEKIERACLPNVAELLARYPVLKKHLSQDELAQLGIQFTHDQATTSHLDIAENLFSEASDKYHAQDSQADNEQAGSPLLLTLAYRLSKGYAKYNNNQKQQHYANYPK